MLKEKFQKGKRHKQILGQVKRGTNNQARRSLVPK